MEVTFPGVTVPGGTMIRTRSPSVTLGAFDGSTGTVTTRVAVVT